MWLEGLHFAGKSAGISSIVLIKLLVGLLKGFWQIGVTVGYTGSSAAKLSCAEM